MSRLQITNILAGSLVISTCISAQICLWISLASIVKIKDCKIRLVAQIMWIKNVFLDLAQKYPSNVYPIFSTPDSCI